MRYLIMSIPDSCLLSYCNVHQKIAKSRLKRVREICKSLSIIYHPAIHLLLQAPKLGILLQALLQIHMASSLLSATSHGENIVKQTLESRLKTNVVDFFHPLSKVQSKTSLNKTSCVNLKDKKILP